MEDSGLRCFDQFIKTLNRYKGFIANYFKARTNNGYVVGFNYRIKVIKRRCYVLSTSRPHSSGKFRIYKATKSTLECFLQSGKRLDAF